MNFQLLAGSRGRGIGVSNCGTVEGSTLYGRRSMNICYILIGFECHVLGKLEQSIKISDEI